MRTVLTAEFGVAQATEKAGAGGFTLTCLGAFDLEEEVRERLARQIDLARQILNMGLPFEKFEPDLLAQYGDEILRIRELIGRSASFRPAAEARAQAIAQAVYPRSVEREFFPVEQVIGGVLALEWSGFAGPKPLSAYIGSRVRVTIEALSVPVDPFTDEPSDAASGQLLAPISGRRS